jgi:hypothetical protein
MRKNKLDSDKEFYFNLLRSELAKGIENFIYSVRIYRNYQPLYSKWSVYFILHILKREGLLSDCGFDVK